MDESPVWSKVDSYLTETLIPADPVLDAAMAANIAAKLPAIDVTPTQAKFLYLLAKIQGAKRILEIGTLGGYSTIWLARALPQDGKLITMEFEPKHAAVAQANIHNAGLDRVVEIRIGRAADSLAALQAENVQPFDLIFIDADKPGYPTYLDWALRLSRPGSIIVADNCVRSGEPFRSGNDDPSNRALNEYDERVASDSRLRSIALPLDEGGMDGFAISVVVGG